VIERSQVRLPTGALLGIATPGKLFTPICASVTKQYNLIRPRGGDVLWLGGNRRSGVALAMCHRLSGLSTYGLKGDEHPTYAPLEYGPPFYDGQWIGSHELRLQ